MAEFEINGLEYVSSKMPAKTQVKLLKRLAPLLPAIQKVAVLMADGETKAGSSEAFQAIVGGLQELKDDDLDFILDETLSLVRVRDGNNWAPVWSRQAGRPMNEDLMDLPTMLQCVSQVIEAEFSGFFSKSAS